MLDQRYRMCIFPQHQHTLVLRKRGKVEMAALASGHHLRMGFEQHRAIGIFRQRRSQHALKAGCISQAMMDRSIARRLVCH